MNEHLTWPTRPAGHHDEPPHPAHAAAAALDWTGTVLPPISLFGCRLLPVVVLDADVHRIRDRDGDTPQLDTDTLTVWEWPESTAPPPAVRLSGALFTTTRRARTALGDARRWRPFGPSALLTPSTDDEPWLRWECSLHGVGLVTITDSVSPVVPAEPGRPAPARRRTADRWIEEKIYAHALENAAFRTATRRRC